MPRVPLHSACARPPDGAGEGPAPSQDNVPDPAAGSKPSPFKVFGGSCRQKSEQIYLRWAAKADASRMSSLPTRILRRRRTLPSAGRAESSRKGLSRRDAAKGPIGHGWPFGPGPWSGDGGREPRHRRGRMMGASGFGYFWRAKSDSPCQAKSVGRAEESAASWQPGIEPTLPEPTKNQRPKNR